MTDAQDSIGVVVGGSLTKSIEVRLDPGRAVSLGQYVMAPLDGDEVILGMVTDVLLRSAESGPTAWPPPAGDDPSSALLRDVLLDTAVYTAAEVSPYLQLDLRTNDNGRARTLPRHFARVSLADQPALDAAFDTAEKPSINLGVPLGMSDVNVGVDIERLFERSAGIFGKSGTGKTVYALQFLSELIESGAGKTTANQKSVALIFDMHDDYGDQLKFEGGNRRSLKQIHPSDVAVYSLERDARGVERRILIGTRDITPDDLRVLQATAEFTPAAIEAAEVLHEKLGAGWIDAVLAQSPPTALLRKVEGAEDGDDDWPAVLRPLDIHSGSFANLRRNLRAIARREFVDSGADQFSGDIRHVVQTLQGGKSVVIQFGRFGRDLGSYMLVANMLSRRIWDAYQRKMTDARGVSADEPNQLVIVIEEAHKFLDKSMGGQNIFGQIARELRKYNVTLLVIDQRPSQIDSEVLSQIGTKFCLQLDSDADIDALVGGMSGRAGLRQVIATLESQQQALVFGHALPMPVVVRTPTYTADWAPGASLRQKLGIERRPATPDGLFG